eukprot:8300004-Pyramimonas_sp.AAC.1
MATMSWRWPGKHFEGRAVNVSCKVSGNMGAAGDLASKRWILGGQERGAAAGGSTRRGEMASIATFPALATRGQLGKP